jgi:hypothetical protein
MVDAAKVRDDKVPAGQILFEQFWVPDCHLPFALDREARYNPFRWNKVFAIWTEYTTKPTHDPV